MRQNRQQAHQHPIVSDQTQRADNHDLLISRRRFLFGAAGAVAGMAALAVAGASIEAGTHTAPIAYALSVSDDGEPQVLSVSSDNVFTSDDCEFIDDASTVIGLAASIELPYGSMVWSNDDVVAACLLPTETASPLTQVGLIQLGSGTMTKVLEGAIGQAEGYEIYDVRANAQGVIWTEANIMDRSWRVYQALAVGGTSIGEAILIDEGNGDWEMPTLAAAGNGAFWQVLPHADGAASKERSMLKRATFGLTDTTEVCSSNGRMATAPYATADGIVITPRVEDHTSYYQLTYLDAETGATRDKLVLPSSMRPYEAGYGNNGFMFCFEAIYNFGDGISNLGTYTPANTDAVQQSVIDESLTEVEGGYNMSASARSNAYSAVPWFRFALDPSAASAPAWCGNWLMVKTQTQVSAVDLVNRRRTALEGRNGTEDFGDYLASTGSGLRTVTYSNIDYTPLDGERQTLCLVRVWQPL